MATIGWTTIAAADTFFETRAGFEAFWLASSNPLKISALTTAYNRLDNTSLLSIPASPTVAELAKLAYAQQEFSIHFIIDQLPDAEIRRLGIQAQNVDSAGIVKETYRGKMGNKAAIPSTILDILEDFKNDQEFYMKDTYRDESDNPTYDSHFGI